MMSMDTVDQHYAGTNNASTTSPNNNYDYDWLFKFSLVYFGHPILFLPYYTKFALTKIFGVFNAFTKVTTNIYRINIILYVAITLPIYLAWLSLQVVLLPRLFQRFSVSKFWDSMTWKSSIIAALPGLLNMFAFVTSGMEGNIFGFIFALPMLLASVAYIVLWIYTLVHSCSGDGNDNGGDHNYSYNYDELQVMP